MRLFVLFLFFCSLNGAFASEREFIIQPNKTTEVYLKDTLSKDLKNAFGLMSRHLAELNKAELKQIINPGPTTRIYLKQNRKLHPDGFKITIRENKMTIEGGTRKGTTYAVVHLLEILGCKKTGPNMGHHGIWEEIAFSCGVIEDKPANDVRIINLYYPEDAEYRDWMRLNTIEEIYPDGYFVHTFHRLVPREIYFQDHPEYFALVNGKRTADQVCPSNPEVKKIISGKLREEMSKQPDKQKWSVSQNDNFSYCQCDKCKNIIVEEGSPAGPIIHLVNDIAKQFPDKIISTLAYQYSRKAPAKVKPRKNVEVMLCTIELHRHAPIETNPECADFKKDMEDWGKICSNIFLWDYTINFNHSISPFPNLHILQPNIQFFTKNHVNALFEQSNSTIGYEFSELKVHLLSKLMWNPKLDFEQEKQSFLHTCYGEGYQYISQYIDALEKNLKETESKLWIYEHPVVHQNGLFSEERMKVYNSFFDMAEQAAKTNPLSLKNIQLARLSLQYAEMEIAANNMFSKRGWYLISDGKALPNYNLRKTLDQFEQICHQNQVPTINESEMSPENYIRSLRRMIDVNIEGNLAFGKKVNSSSPPDKKYQSGDLSYLTNGVSGASDYNIHWLGWFGNDTELILDLDTLTQAKNISIHSLWNGKSWILHPSEVSCSISADGKTYSPIGTIRVEGEQQKEDPIRNYPFQTENNVYRYVKFTVKGTGKLFNWHPSAGEPSWFFLDEITVKD
ncbi:DUF4838 domain-containing protein [Fluviicola taffensis]|uniref:DUF4838 domain-containing protein n=1 Tax=Fluviicola taffensis TaxID=191579 RepID=UPI003137D46D